VGRCEPPTFQSAGGHFNPLGKKHGLENPEGAHGGDLPDLEVDASGRIEYVVVTDRVALAPGPTSVFDADGSAVVIHARADDQRTDPSGNSGERLLCGQLVTGPGGASSIRP
jgi:Cu-Zn family superoxide dismutase